MWSREAGKKDDLFFGFMRIEHFSRITETEPNHPTMRRKFTSSFLDDIRNRSSCSQRNPVLPVVAQSSVISPFVAFEQPIQTFVAYLPTF